MGYWSLVIGHWSLVMGYWLLVIGYWSLVIGHWSLVIGHWSLGMSWCTNKVPVGGVEWEAAPPLAVLVRVQMTNDKRQTILLIGY